MDTKHEQNSNGIGYSEKLNGDEPAKPHGLKDHLRGRQFSTTPEDRELIDVDQNQLHRKLKGRHMQMIALGGAIGAGLFIGSGSALASGGPASLVIGFAIVGVVVYLMMQQLAELTVLYPINGAFTMYICRFVDPSWGFACSWEYAISWLTVLPYEISAACQIINYWPGANGISNAAWICPLLFALMVIQIFGVRGYGEVEFVLSIMKVTACIGFIILGIIIDTGGVPTDDRGYIGGRYWNNPGAFRSGFHGFCSVFVTAAFAYTGTELTGLAAAETVNPLREIPRASKQVVWRIFIFYVVNLLLVGLVVPYDNDQLVSASGSHASPFVIAIQLAGIKGLPSVFNAVILIAVLSVANACTYGSTRTVQALAANGMAPKAAAYIDRKGRPLVVVFVQLLFGCLAFINLAPDGSTIFTWLLSLSGLSILFIYGSIGLAHIRFRMAWKHNGRSVDELPYKAHFGIYGSYVSMTVCILALVAQFYVALYPVGDSSGYLNAETFFELYLAGPLLIFLYLVWKVYSWFYRPQERPLYVPISKIDIYTGMREETRLISGVDVPADQRRASIQQMQEERKKRGVKDYALSGIRNII